MKINELKSRVVIEYGRKGGNDVDKIIILENGIIPKEYSLSWPEDAWETTVGEFLQMISDRHPAVTEPVLKGEVTEGDKQWLQSLQKQLLEEQIPDTAVCALGEWAIWNMKTVGRFLDRYYENHNLTELAMALGNMSYATSCSLFSAYYKRNPSGIVTLEIVLEAFPFQRKHFDEIRTVFKCAQAALFYGDVEPSIESFNRLAETTGYLIIDMLSS